MWPDNSKHSQLAYIYRIRIIMIIIIIKQLVKQHMSVKNKLTNRSSWLATAVSEGKIC